MTSIDQEGHDLGERGAAFVQFRAHHQDAVRTQIQQQSGQRGAEDAARRVAAAQKGAEIFARDLVHQSDRQHAGEDAPPDRAHHHGCGVGEGGDIGNRHGRQMQGDRGGDDYRRAV